MDSFTSKHLCKEVDLKNDESWAIKASDAIMRETGMSAAAANIALCKLAGRFGGRVGYVQRPDVSMADDVSELERLLIVVFYDLHAQDDSSSMTICVCGDAQNADLWDEAKDKVLALPETDAFLDEVFERNRTLVIQRATFKAIQVNDLGQVDALVKVHMP